MDKLRNAGVSSDLADTREPIDAVYLWVDGSDPSFKEALATCGEEPRKAAAQPSRFRDNGELRYSLRSLEMHAPWIRKVYLVTNGQVPAWLDTSYERIEVVPHEAIFPDPSHLPTFNSNSIDLHLHRIPGLSERFIIFNDDTFLGQPITREDFLEPTGGQRLLFEALPLPSDLADANPLRQACARTQLELNRLYGHQAFRPFPAHAPRLADRRLIRQIEGLLPEWFAATSSHRFRCEEDLPLWILYPFHLLEAPEHRGEHQGVIHAGLTKRYGFFSMQADLAITLRCFSLLAEWRPKFFCINDDLGDVAVDHPLPTILRGLLEALFPTSSRFEKGETGALIAVQNSIERPDAAALAA